MDQYSFYVVLPSNTPIEGNKTSNFMVRLPNTLELQEGNWTVALSSIIYPISFMTLGSENEGIQYIKISYSEKDQDGNEVGIRSLNITIPPAIFQNVEYLSEFLNDIILSSIHAEKHGTIRTKRAADAPSAGENHEVYRKLNSAKNAAIGARINAMKYANEAVMMAQDTGNASGETRKEAKNFIDAYASISQTVVDQIEIIKQDVENDTRSVITQTNTAHEQASKASEAERQVHSLAAQERPNVKQVRAQADIAKKAGGAAKEARDRTAEFRDRVLNNYNLLKSKIAEYSTTNTTTNIAETAPNAATATVDTHMESNTKDSHIPADKPTFTLPTKSIHWGELRKDRIRDMVRAEISKTKSGESLLYDRQAHIFQSQIHHPLLYSSNLSQEERIDNQKIYFYFDKEIRKFYLVFLDSSIVKVQLSEQLFYMLGFEDGNVETEGYAKYMPDISGGKRQLFVYAPGLVEDTVIGNTTAPLLRVVNINPQNFGEVSETIYTSEYHCRLTTKQISQIRIQIRSATGNLIDFHWGDSIVTLHFRRSIF